MSFNAKVTPRHQILAFLGCILSSDAGPQFYRLHQFTQFSESKNPEEYERKYTDEPHKRTDVVAYAPQIDYAFDRYGDSGTPNYPLKELMNITDGEYVGEKAKRVLVVVDTVTGTAYQRTFSVIPNAEGDDANVYTYSGTLKACGDRIAGTATSSDGWETITFKESTQE